ncbi:MAG: [FeFe] hydrogenase H-cluster radical SAM maturase HydG [Candidatus Xenobiia bacterium LiM19]
MKHIDEAKIEDLLSGASSASPGEISGILDKAMTLTRLSLRESAALLSLSDPALLEKLYETASQVKRKIYGTRMVLFVPLYVSNFCVNNCLYCGFRCDNAEMERKALSMDEVADQVRLLLRRGHKRILMVSGETAPPGKSGVEYFVETIETIYRVHEGSHQVKRVNVNLPPLTVEEFQALKRAGIGTYQLFQETYHDRTYRQVHRGPKADPDNRLDAVDRAFQAGIDDIGIGVLYGLYEYRFETLALLSHIEHMEKAFNVGPHTISVPRIQPAKGSVFSQNAPAPVSDADFKKLVAVLRLSVPYTGIILSTRETGSLRDELFAVGISQVSAESSTSPGGYSDGSDGSQFDLHDSRSLDEVVGALVDGGFIPSFCAACYRRERTGKAFMELAKPGEIRHMCDINALVTFKEYLLDFASEEVKEKGEQLLQQRSGALDGASRAVLSTMLEGVERGGRDEYV